MRRDQTRAPEPMRSTLPNTDQPRIPHSDNHYNHRAAVLVFLGVSVGGGNDLAHLHVITGRQCTIAE